MLRLLALFLILVTARAISIYDVCPPVTVEPKECVLTSWNVIALNKFTSGGSDTEGRLAGYNVTIDGGYSVSANMPVITDGNRNDLISYVGTWGSSGGQVAGGGNIIYTDTNSNYNYATMVNAGQRLRKDVSPWFTFAMHQIIDASSRLARLATTGTTTIYYNTVTFTGSNGNPNVFFFNGDLFPSSTEFSLSNVPAGATVIINVNGSSITTPNVGMWSASSYNVVWNLYQAVTITNSLSWEGTLLAPYATVNLGYNRIEGGVYVRDYNGPTQINYFPYNGIIPLCLPYSTDCVKPVSVWCVNSPSWLIPTSTTTCGKTWLHIEETSAGTDGWSLLAQQYVAARLNIAKGASASYSVQAQLAGALTWLNQCIFNPTGANLATANSFTTQIRSYNTGGAGTSACAPAPSRSPTPKPVSGRRAVRSD